MWGFLLALALWVPGASIGRAEVPVVAVAANLRFPLEEIAESFRGQGEGSVRLSFGSSGNIRRQIVQGAPFELFLSADEANAVALEKAGLADQPGVTVAVGQLVLYAPPGSPIGSEPVFSNLAKALDRGLIRRFAIANWEHAPYGKAAREVLEHERLWARIRPHLVVGENAGQAAQFAVSGSAEGGLIPYSMVLAPGFAKEGRFTLVPASTHSPLRQQAVLLKKAGATARGFFAYLQSPEARVVFLRHGFLSPD